MNDLVRVKLNYLPCDKERVIILTVGGSGSYDDVTECYHCFASILRSKFEYRDWSHCTGSEARIEKYKLAYRHAPYGTDSVWIFLQEDRFTHSGMLRLIDDAMAVYRQQYIDKHYISITLKVVRGSVSYE